MMSLQVEFHPQLRILFYARKFRGVYFGFRHKELFLWDVESAWFEASAPPVEIRYFGQGVEADEYPFNLYPISNIRIGTCPFSNLVMLGDPTSYPI